VALTFQLIHRNALTLNIHPVLQLHSEQSSHFDMRKTPLKALAVAVRQRSHPHTWSQVQLSVAIRQKNMYTP